MVDKPQELTINQAAAKTGEAMKFLRAIFQIMETVEGIANMEAYTQSSKDFAKEAEADYAIVAAKLKEVRDELAAKNVAVVEAQQEAKRLSTQGRDEASTHWANAREAVEALKKSGKDELKAITNDQERELAFHNRRMAEYKSTEEAQLQKLSGIRSEIETLGERFKP